MQRSFNMLKECSRFSEIDFISILPLSKVNSFYDDFETGKKDIYKNLEKYCRKVALIDHGARNRSKNKIRNALKSLVSKDPYDVVALKSKLFSDEIRKALESRSYDIVYVDTIGLCPLFEDHVPISILNHHNIESEMLSRRAKLSPFPLSIYLSWQAQKTRKLEKRYCPKANLNFTCSNLDSSRLKSIAECEAIEIPNGVDTKYFRRSSRYEFEQTKGAIFAGGLDWYPNASAVDFIVQKIVPELIANKLRIPISVYGKGRHKGLILASEIMSEYVIRGGFVDDIRIPMERARMYLCPITDGGGTKLKVLDALAMGIPLIANPIACEGIDVEDGRNVIFAKSVAEYLNAMKKLNADPVLCNKLSEAGIELIQSNYTYESIGLKIEKAFKGVVRGQA